MSFIFIDGLPTWKYYLLNPLMNNEPYEVSEEDFERCIGFDRSIYPMRYDEKDINRQNFYDGDRIIAYRVRGESELEMLSLDD